MTLGIVAYNQSRFIQHAIDGALAQTYSPLEIILSDDGSEDDTFDIIRRAADNYRGPHKVIANQVSHNKCILGHVFEICDLANGEMLVLGDGDDISHPQRVERAAAAWVESRPTAVFSNYELMNEAGEKLLDEYAPDKHSQMLEQVFCQADGHNIHGASAAYDLSFMRSLPRPSGRFFFEDLFMTFMIHLHGGTILKLPDALVRYRQHAASITNDNGRVMLFADIKQKQIKSAEYEQNKQELYAFFESVLDQAPQNVCTDLSALREHAMQAGIRGNWINMSTFERLVTMLDHSDPQTRMWLAPRLFGLNVFAALRHAKAVATLGARQPEKDTAH